LQRRPNETAFDSPAVIFVPAALHYPGARFTVRTTARFVRWDVEKQLLYWLPLFAGDHAVLVIHPPSQFDPRVLPAYVQSHVPSLTFMKTSQELVGPIPAMEEAMEEVI